MNNHKSENKILILTGIYPPDIGGPATILKALVESLEKNNFSVELVTYSDPISKAFPDQKNIHRIRRNQFFLWQYLEYFLQAFRLAVSANLIYVMDVYSVGYFAYLLKKILGKKYIVRFAGDSAWETAVSNGWTNDYIVDFQQKNYDQRIEKLKERRKQILISADRVIAVSQFMAIIAGKIGVSKDKIKIIYNSIDFFEHDNINLAKIQSIKQEYGQSAKLLITACRLTPWKGVDGIIRILPGLSEKVGKVNLLVLGEGQELENLKKLASSLNVKNNVYFLGKVTHQEIINYFKAADLFVLNTNYEGLSHTILEAMLAQVPIITTNAGGNPEVIEDGKDGLVVEYNNNEELLAASLKILIDEQLVKGLVLNASRKLEDFRWDKTIDGTIQLLKEVKNE
ncbi:MAG: hypothetical protein A3J62_03675 [Candidatus Buchananbacteria bacterium RIFCSPHIGHO2_02_FULL_38_8]|uniref:Glycosyl transferase family 1 domain-containing protein n=2 Tax=Candidatus Buchananiibacteriota TaxID=1817903 RepID=A0A1G1XUT5_9BACT|nr:MAG: hypothetical protein A2731_00770 [Candidatus Buchananbacteria bacterium RIFCSPHIGHO2_01_FULL_39_8]OGY46835.1 MAG: hypothetical protein A3J62_03675 [Candidatus Buchananbacteria bacterium RIFCSPHIGHO2_02_FULL_38_8]